MAIWLLIPLIIIVSVLVVFGLLVFLGRFKNGKYLRPIILWLNKIPWLSKQFQKVSQAAIEKQNPDLASAMRKLQRVGPNPDQKKLTQAYHSLSQEERRAYQEAIEQQGGMPEAPNRQMRRAQQRQTQGNRPPSRPAGNTKRGKKR
jgi:hypothetical protein